MRLKKIVYFSLIISLLFFVQCFSYVPKTFASEDTDINISLDDFCGTEYFIKNLYSGKYLDVSGGIAANGTNVQQYEYNGTDSQRWMIAKKPNGASNEVVILTRLGNANNLYVYALDISNASSDDGANAQIYTYNSTSAQTFMIDYNQDFNFRIKPKCTSYSKAISISGNGFDNEVNVVQKSLSDNANQSWILEPVVRNSNFGRNYTKANYDNHLMTFPNCENMGGDCTNFVSQCLLAEGVHMRDNWYMYKKNTVFEAPTNVVSFRFSWNTGDPAPWISANDFMLYWGSADHRVEKAYGYKGSYITSNIQEVFETTNLQVGDVIQLAYMGPNDSLGNAHHSMIVSSIRNNRYYIAEHTYSRFDKDIITIASKEPNQYILFYKFFQ